MSSLRTCSFCEKEHAPNQYTPYCSSACCTVKCELQGHPNVSAGGAGADIKVSCNSHFRNGWRVPLERAPNGMREIASIVIQALEEYFQSRIHMHQARPVPELPFILDQMQQSLQFTGGGTRRTRFFTRRMRRSHSC
jgi:hypothetical protein